MRLALERGLFLASLLLLAWVIYLAANHGLLASRLGMAPILLPLAFVLGTAAPLLGDRHPRWRWALLVATGVVLIASFVLLRGAPGA